MSDFAFYQEVRIARPAPANADRAGGVGVIVGRGDAPGEPLVYGVLLHGCDEVVSCDAGELEPTGRQFRREEIYDDARRVRVRVDERGRGECV